MTIHYLNRYSQYCCENRIKPHWYPFALDQLAIVHIETKPPIKFIACSEWKLDYPVLKDPSDLYPKIP